MANQLKQQLNDILKVSLTPFLKGIGFRKSDLNYVCPMDGLSWLISVQKSRWNDSEEGRFTLNFGVYVPQTVSIYTNKQESAKPRLEHCAVYIRAGMLMPERLDRWWTVRHDGSGPSGDDIAQELRDVTEYHGLEFLRRFDTPVSVAEFLEQPLPDSFKYALPTSEVQRLAYSAIIYCLSDESENARRVLVSANKASQATPLAQVVADLGSHFDRYC